MPQPMINDVRCLYQLLVARRTGRLNMFTSNNSNHTKATIAFPILTLFPQAKTIYLG